MTKYILELYDKSQRRPYKTMEGYLPNGLHPTYVDSRDCFNYVLKGAARVKVRYRSNGGLVADSYVDAKGEMRLRWRA